MAKSWTKTEAFASFGTKLANTRWSWSARSEDGKTVVLALWSDRFSRKSSPLVYDGTRIAPNEEWIERRGNKERLENLRWARNHCGGLFKVVMIKPRDPNLSPREIEDAFPKPQMAMRIAFLDENTGEFLAELAGNSSESQKNFKA